MIDWHVGQKVVCVDDDWSDFYPGEIDPVRGVIYTIREIDIDPEENLPIFLFEEIINPVRPGYDLEVGYVARRFRPVVNQSTDISVFTSILDKINNREVVDA